jgi:EcsC protein family
MSDDRKSWLRLRIEDALRRGLTEAYDTIKVDPHKFLMQLRAAHGLPVSNYQGMFTLDPNLLDELAEQTVRAAQKMAAAEGAGLGLGGVFTIVPDLGILAGITMRTVQKLSLIYGFEYNTEDEIAELWIAAAFAAGVDISREVLERQVVQRFVPRVIQRIAAQAGGELAEKLAGRLVPLLSSAIGGTLNWWFVRAWGERAKAHFREKHLRVRNANPPLIDAD